MVGMAHPTENMLRQRRQSGFTLIEATMAMVLLGIAAAGILLPFSAAAAAQTDAQRRVVAVRFAADVIEGLVAKDAAERGSLPASFEITPASFDPPQYTGAAYQGLSCQVEKQDVSVGSVSLILLSATVKDQQRPMATLKTLVGNGE